MHAIRLRGPWQLVAADDQPSAQRVQVPCDPGEILGPDVAGPVRLIRPFNTPTNLDPHERVHLVLEDLPCSASLTLNGAALPCPTLADAVGARIDAAGARIDITEHLALHNRLEVTLLMPGGVLGEVRLEIG